jgi:hypothetical protein
MNSAPHLIATAIVGIGILVAADDLHCRSNCHAEPNPFIANSNWTTAEELSCKVGWYLVSGGDSALVTWSEPGELLLLRPKHGMQRFRLVPRDRETFDVLDHEGNWDGTLAFGKRRTGEVGGFHWLHESNLSTIGERTRPKMIANQFSRNRHQPTPPMELSPAIY